MINKVQNRIVEGASGRPVLFDISFKADGRAKPVVIFWHGFKGFKDWGFWSLMGERFAEEEFVFLAANFSHNGTTPDEPAVFGDLEAFGQNNYSKELTDMSAILDWLEKAPGELVGEVDLSRIYLIGHSRGGGIAVIQAARDTRIKKLVTWAAVSRLDYLWQRSPEMVEPWRKKGVHYMYNGRTKQEMPLYFQLYEDFQANARALDISVACTRLTIPVMIIHGKADPAVPVEAAEELADWCSAAQMVLLDDADHVFGGRHPYQESFLPKHAEMVTAHTITFLQEET